MTDVLPYQRRERHERDGAAYFLTFSCYGRLPLYSNDAIKERFVERLAAIPELSFLAWVVTPAHVHLVLIPPAPIRLPDMLKAIKTPFAREVLNRWKKLGWSQLPRLRDEKGHHFWQEGGGYDRLVYGRGVREEIACLQANPLRRKVAQRSIDYTWSSAAAYEGLASIGPAIALDLVLQGCGPLT